MKWDRTIDVLGLSYTLDQINLDIGNVNRLPRTLVFRQPYWGEGKDRRPGSELFLEAMLGGNICPSITGTWIAATRSQNDYSNLYTVVEIDWYEDDIKTHGPWIRDIKVFDHDGNYIDSARRDRAARLLARAQKEASEAGVPGVT